MDFKKFMEVASTIDNEQILKELMGSVKILGKNDPGAKELAKAQNIIVKDGLDSSVYEEKPYIVTTRNQRYVNSVLPDNRDNAFVILSAADTLFELVSNDFKNIVSVDTNELQEFIYKLRRASILTLSTKDFENFLINYNDKKYMSLDVFKTVKEGFEKNDIKSINFWEQLLSLNPKEDLIEHFFKGVGGNISKTLYALPYLKRKVSYYELREKLEKANIIIKKEEALTYLLNNPDNKFDYIDITNILLFIYQFQCKDNEDDFKEKIKVLKTIYDQNLNNNGVFVLDYLFGINIEDLNISDENIHEYIRKIYKVTQEELNKMFNIETYNYEKLIDGFGPKNDTVVLTRKLNQ